MTKQWTAATAGWAPALRIQIGGVQPPVSGVVHLLRQNGTDFLVTENVVPPIVRLTTEKLP